MFTAFKRFLGRLFRATQKEPPAPPHDPFAYRAVVRSRGPNKRGGAVAVLEPDEMQEEITISFGIIRKNQEQ